MIRFGEYFRPGQLAFYKSSDYGQTYEPWHYFVSTADPNECQDKFNMPVNNNPVRVDQVLCMVYTSQQVEKNDEVCIIIILMMNIFTPMLVGRYFFQLSMIHHNSGLSLIMGCYYY